MRDVLAASTTDGMQLFLELPDVAI